MRVEKQSLILSIGTVVLMFAQWLISVLLVRIGSFTDAGVFSLAMSISNVFIGFACYGMRNYQVSDIKGQFTQGQYLLTRTVLIFVALAGCAVYLMLGAYSGLERWAIMLYYAYSGWLYWGDALMGSMQLKGRLEINGYSNMIKGTGCFLVFMVSYVVKKDMLLSLSLMALAMALITVMYDIPQYKKVEGFKRLEMADIKALLKICRTCFPLMVAAILPIAVNAYPRRVINLTLGNEQLGFFASLFAPTSIITMAVPTMFLGFAPQITATWDQNDAKAYRKTIFFIYAAITAFTLFVELCAVVAGRPLMRMVFGDELMPYYKIFYFAVLASGLSTLTICGNMILTCIRKSVALAVMSAVELMTTLALSGPLISAMGIKGAAITLVISYGSHAALQIIAIAVSGNMRFKCTKHSYLKKGENKNGA